MRIRSVLKHSAQAIAEGSLIALLVVGLMAGSVFAAKGGHGGGKPGGGGGACTQNAPGVAVDNTWSWSGRGSWGLPGQKLTYAINVINYDVGCGSSTFTVSVAAPSGFTVSMPTSSISLSSSRNAYLWAYVTSPTSVANIDYPLIVTVARTGTSSPTGSFTTYYKVYSSDTVAPTLFWQNPGDGMTITGSSYNISVSSIDDHAVRQIDLFVDGVSKSTSVCDNISDTCDLYYKWATSPGQHTATYKSYDWLGNVGTLTVSFTVN
jgi:hypothetical protein